MLFEEAVTKDAKAEPWQPHSAEGLKFVSHEEMLLGILQYYY